jgi:hypothetical protein
MADTQKRCQISSREIVFPRFSCGGNSGAQNTRRAIANANLLYFGYIFASSLLVNALGFSEPGRQPFAMVMKAATVSSLIGTFNSQTV